MKKYYLLIFAFFITVVTNTAQPHNHKSCTHFVQPYQHNGLITYEYLEESYILINKKKYYKCWYAHTARIDSTFLDKVYCNKSEQYLLIPRDAQSHLVILINDTQDR